MTEPIYRTYVVIVMILGMSFLGVHSIFTGAGSAQRTPLRKTNPAVREALQKYSTENTREGLPSNVEPLFISIDAFIDEWKERLLSSWVIVQSGWELVSVSGLGVYYSDQAKVVHKGADGTTMQDDDTGIMQEEFVDNGMYERVNHLNEQIAQEQFVPVDLGVIEEHLKKRIGSLTFVSEGIMWIQLRVSASDKDLYEKFKKDFKEPEPTGQAYLSLGLDPKNRDAITIEQISTAIIATERKCEHKSDAWQRGREAAQILRHPEGKKNYDAFLGGITTLTQLRISQKEAPKYGLAGDDVVHEKIRQLHEYKALLEGILKRMSGKLSKAHTGIFNPDA